MTHRSWLVAALVLGASIPARAQQIGTVVPVAEERLVRQAAFTLWWPEYERLIREFKQHTPSENGGMGLPEPRPDDFYNDIQILGRVLNPPLGQVALYGVTTEGDLFQGLFVVRQNRAWPLVNRVDPASFRQDFTNTYVDAVNALLERGEVRTESPQAALSLARFMVEVFYNFDYRYMPGSVDSLTFAELNLVRVLQSTDEIPQGVRRFDPDNGNALLYGKIPERVQGTVTPPRVQTGAEGEYVVTFYTWHPIVGELKRWEIRLSDGRFTALKDQTIEKWSSYTVENF
jgi:hypothetical protein